MVCLFFHLKVELNFQKCSKMKSDNNSKLFILKNSRVCWDENLKIRGQFLISIKARPGLMNTWCTMDL